jgi:hypothetical protein
LIDVFIQVNLFYMFIHSVFRGELKLFLLLVSILYWFFLEVLFVVILFFFPLLTLKLKLSCYTP